MKGQAQWVIPFSKEWFEWTKEGWINTSHKYFVSEGYWVFLLVKGAQMEVELRTRGIEQEDFCIEWEGSISSEGYAKQGNKEKSIALLGW